MEGQIGFSFSVALEAIKLGKRVTRTNWSRDSFVFMQIPANIPTETADQMQSLPASVKDYIKKNKVLLLNGMEYKNQLIYAYRSKSMHKLTMTYFVADGNELLADNWVILD